MIVPLDQTLTHACSSVILDCVTYIFARSKCPSPIFDHRFPSWFRGLDLADDERTRVSSHMKFSVRVRTKLGLQVTEHVEIDGRKVLRRICVSF